LSINADQHYRKAKYLVLNITYRFSGKDKNSRLSPEPNLWTLGIVAKYCALVQEIIITIYNLHYLRLILNTLQQQMAYILK
jgi:hypothetical protein